MARKINRLNSRMVATITKPGRHADGGNLYLSVSESGTRSWVFMFRWNGRTREIGFGSARDVPLAKARELARDARVQLALGSAPVGPRKATAGRTFGELADRLVEDMRPGWRNEKHGKQWEMTLQVYAAPLRHLPADRITTEDVLAVLKPLWNEKRETANRVRGRIERVLDAAKAQGLRGGENPARWRGHLDQLLPRRQKVAKAHHAALPYRDVPGFMGELRSQQGIAARALEFCILVAARSGEVLGARREEFDLEAGLWTVPGNRMKGGRVHEVPLPTRAVEIVREAIAYQEGELVFPGQRRGKPMAAMALDMALHRLRPAGVTVHGMRSAFRDWAGDCTNHPREVAEAALAHVIPGVEGDYRRGSAVERRRRLMEDWADYCGQSRTATVVQLRA